MTFASGKTFPARHNDAPCSPATPVCAPADALFNRIIEDTQQHASGIDAAAERLNGIANWIFGKELEEALVPAPASPQSNSALGRLHDANMWLSHARLRLAEAVERLEKL